MRIKEARMARGLSQKDFAAMVNIAPNTLSQYETEKREPDLKTLVRISRSLGVSVDYLLGVDEKEPSLMSDEAYLLGSYRGFNGEGKERAREFVTAMRHSGMYAAGTDYFAR